MKLDHINIKAPRDLLEREKAFFCEVLGLRDGRRPDIPAPGYWLYSDNDAIVHLSEDADAGRTGGGGYLDHVAFQTTGLKGVIQALEERRIEYSLSYIAELDLTQVFCRAPSNTRIEVNFRNEKL